jgi:osmotically inducible protein OsmC
MTIRHAQAVWTGTLRQGSGTMKVGSGYFEGPFTFASRFEEAKGTNPEELVGAAHAGCFSMFLSALLTDAGFAPTRITTSATVHLETTRGGPAITTIELDTAAQVPGLDEAAFKQHAEAAKRGCPVSKALAGVEIKLSARLVE